MEEAQNMSPNQMKTLLTRIGDNSKFIISGDLDQSDRFRHYHQSGLYDATIKHTNLMRLVKR
jgi:phosphate starvation-inducible protein PhoH